MFVDTDEFEGSPQESALQKLWSRRLTLPNCLLEEPETTLLEDIFPSATEEDDKTCSSTNCYSAKDGVDCHQHVWTKDDVITTSKVQDAYTELDGALLGDIPARYIVPVLASYEYPVVGVWVHPGVVPGFKYRVRPIQNQDERKAPRHFFKGRALTLQSIGRGYSKRLTFEADNNTLNDNTNFFWSDSGPNGFAFEIEVVTVGDKFTLHDANHVASGTMEVVGIESAQQEVGQVVLPDGSIEKTVRVQTVAKIEWFEEGQATVVLPVSGLVVAVKPRHKQCAATVTKVLDVQIGSHHRRGFSLTPGVNDKWRRTIVQGHTIGDVPTRYTIIGLEVHELPVIGTYVDPRIVPGFTYRIRPCGSNRPLFSGRPLRLTSIGPGYAKRLTFASDANRLNTPNNYLWSDSHPEGLGFEPRAVCAGMLFSVTAAGQRLGEASVFRADAIQQEEKQDIVVDSCGTTIIKYIHIDVTCHVTLLSTNEKCDREAQVMRLSGTAVVAKKQTANTARLIRVENIGLDSQLNLMFLTQHTELVFYPTY